MHKDFVPEKYGMVICPVCDGERFLIKSSCRSDNFGRSACAKRGGFGAVRNEEEVVLRNPEN